MAARYGRVALGALIIALALATRPGPAMAGDHAPPSRTGGGMIGDPAAADALMQAVELTATDTAVYDSFGWAVAVSKDGATAVIGAPGILENGTKRGAAYVFARSGTTWTQQQKLIPGEGEPGDSFGFAVALSADGTTAVIGAAAITLYEEIPATNAAYIFTRSGTAWTQRQKLTGGDTAHGDGFGYAVAISGDGTTAAIGAPAKNGGTGEAYVFARDGDRWAAPQGVTASDAAGRDNFGGALAMSGDGGTLVIGAGDKDGGVGAAYVFARGGATWSERQELVADDAAAKSYFGIAAAISTDGATAVVGASGHAVGDYTPGAAYVFARSGDRWNQTQTLAPSDPRAGTTFGWAVAVSGAGDAAVIGQYGDAAYLFTRPDTSLIQWQQLADNAPGSDNHFTHFGSAVAMSADRTTVLIGAPTHGDLGAAFVFTSPALPGA